MEIKAIVLPLDLGAYDAVYTGQMVWVWVNLPTALQQKRLDLLRALGREIGTETRLKREPWIKRWWATVLQWLRRRQDATQAQMTALMAEVWSAADDAATHWPVTEIQTLQMADPALYAWLVRSTWQMIDRWQMDKKKGFAKPPNTLPPNDAPMTP